MQLAGLVLAAGGARRFGSPKVLAPFHGEPMVRRAASLLSPLCPAGVYVVTGDGEAAIRTALDGTGATCVLNPGWAEGLSSSLRAGVAALPPEVEAVMILLADTPAVTDQDLKSLVAAWKVEPQLVAAASFGDRAGPPVILPRELWPELAALRGDQGARSLLQWHTELVTVPMPHAALDVDTPADLARLEARPAQ